MSNNVFNNKRVIIYGDSGFKGRWLTIWLLHLNAEVYGISRHNSESDITNQIKENSKFHQIDIDILDKSKMIDSVKRIKPDFLFHLAAQPLVNQSFASPVDTFATNTLGVVHVLEALRLAGRPCTAVFATTDSTWLKEKTDPSERNVTGSNPYVASKQVAEIIINSYYRSFFAISNIRICTVKSGNLIGGGDWTKSRIIPDCMNAWGKNEPLKIRDPYSSKPYQHVLNILSGYLRVAEAISEDNHLNGEAFSFNPGEEQVSTTIELVQEVFKHWDLPESVKPYEYVAESSNELQIDNTPNQSLDTIAYPLDWTPILNFQESVEFTARWYNSFYNEGKSSYDLTLDQIIEFERLVTLNKT